MPGSALITANVMNDHPVWGECVFLEATGDAEAIRGEYTERGVTIRRPLDDDTRRQDWVETLVGDDVWYSIAERDGAPVAHLTLYPDPHDDKALHIASTAVRRLPEL
jgi:hypothetical protein